MTATASKTQAAPTDAENEYESALDRREAHNLKIAAMKAQRDSAFAQIKKGAGADNTAAIKAHREAADFLAFADAQADDLDEQVNAAKQRRDAELRPVYAAALAAKWQAMNELAEQSRRAAAEIYEAQRRLTNVFAGSLGELAHPDHDDHYSSIQRRVATAEGLRMFRAFVTYLA